NCGYAGFDLSCNNQSQTIITFPSSGDFIVQWINYREQTLFINGTDNCIPKRRSLRSCSRGRPWSPQPNFRHSKGSLDPSCPNVRPPLPKRFLHRDFSFKDTPFFYYSSHDSTTNYTFFNCSPDQVIYWPSRIVSCLGTENYTVLALPTTWTLPHHEISLPNCTVISTTLAPKSFEWEEINHGFELAWDVPACRYCEVRGQACGLKKGKSLTSRCFRTCQSHHPIAELSTLTSQQPSTIVTGLDASTIESYPKTLLGESWELPKSNDNSCPICLSEYKSKETLRTIPECNHYFHASGVDEWLRMNATCPLCRNPQER
ncbi:hypothetical protein PRUPE_5G119800, partial [Prunus persica]